MKTMTSEETENGLKNNLTITFPTNTSHKSFYRAITTMNLFKQLNKALEFTELKLSNHKFFCLTASHTNQLTA